MTHTYMASLAKWSHRKHERLIRVGHIDRRYFGSVLGRGGSPSIGSCVHAAHRQDDEAHAAAAYACWSWAFVSQQPSA